MIDEMALNDAALAEALGGAPPDGGMGAPGGNPGECPLCMGPVDPETGMTTAVEVPPAPSGGGPMPPGMF